jgi:hypothetical protein
LSHKKAGKGDTKIVLDKDAKGASDCGGRPPMSGGGGSVVMVVVVVS